MSAAASCGAAASTSAGANRSLAPLATMMRFSPSAATRISAAPVGASRITRTPEVCTPNVLKLRMVSAPSRSPPTAATISTLAPHRAAATAWLAPLPPNPMSKPVPNTVSPPLGTTSLMNCRSVLALPTTTMRGLSATVRSPVEWAWRSDVLHRLALHERDVEDGCPAGNRGAGHALLQQRHRPGADGRERLRYRRQARADDPGPADIVESGDRHVVGNLDVMLGEKMNRVDGDQVIAGDDEGGPLPAQQGIPGFAGEDAIEPNTHLPCDLQATGKRAHETVAPLLGALQVARSGKKSDAGVPLLQGVLGEQLSPHPVVGVHGRESRPGTIDQHDGPIERSQRGGHVLPDRTPDDPVDSMLREQDQAVALARGATLTVDEAYEEAETAGGVLHGLGELREEGVGEVRQNQADRPRAALAHRLRGPVRAVAELLRRAQDLLPHRRTDVRLVVQNVGDGSDRHADFGGEVFYGCHRASAAGSSAPPSHLVRASIHSQKRLTRLSTPVRGCASPLQERDPRIQGGQAQMTRQGLPDVGEAG